MSGPEMPSASPMEGRLQLAVVLVLAVLLGVQIWQSAGHRWQVNPIPLRDCPAEATEDLRMDVNTASAADLEHLPGLGKRRAAAIVADRQERGRFASVAELERVPGIGPATVKLISPYVRVGPTAASESIRVRVPEPVSTRVTKSAPEPQPAPGQTSVPKTGGGTLAAPPPEPSVNEPVPGTVLRKPRGTRVKKPTPTRRVIAQSPAVGCFR